MYAIKVTFTSGDVQNLRSESYDTVSNWWRIFSPADVMADIGIIEMVLLNTEGSVVAAKTGVLKAAA